MKKFIYKTKGTSRFDFVYSDSLEQNADMSETDNNNVSLEMYVNAAKKGDKWESDLETLICINDNITPNKNGKRNRVSKKLTFF